MKKRIWGIVVGIMVLALGMFVVGVLKRKPIKEDSEGETYLEQVEADKEKVKTEGSVFPKEAIRYIMDLDLLSRISTYTIHMKSL